MSGRRSKQRKLTPQEEAARRLRDARERMSREHYGLQEDQLFAAHGLLSDDVDFMRTMARDDGIAVRETGAGVGKLASLGFIEVRRSNGHDAITKLTEAALRALVLRLARR